MIIRVAERASLSGAKQVLVATDDQRIAKVVKDHKFDCVLTNSNHLSGTDRLVEAAKRLDLLHDEIVVNVQGDEPEIEPKLIADVAKHLDSLPHVAVATACQPINSTSDFLNPNVVKVILDKNGRAIYFSRSPIPWARANNLERLSTNLTKNIAAYQHIGIYAYRYKFLEKYSLLHQPEIENSEQLEQLRVIWNGYAIACLVTENMAGAGIDTPADLDKLIKTITHKN